MELLQGERLANRFKVIGCLGNGALGPVFLAKEPNASHAIALKVIKSAQIISGEVQDRLRHEVAVARQLKDPSILAPLEYIDSAGFTGVASEYVASENLLAVMQAGALPVEQVYDIIVQVAELLAVLHAHGLSHGALKPSNILISPEGQVRLTDCGCAVLAELSEKSFRRGAVQYCAPEFLRAPCCSERTDVYSWGVIAFELLTGALPQEGADTTAAHPVNFFEACPPVLAAIIMRATAQDPALRYQSSAELLCHLYDISRNIHVYRPLSGRGFLLGCIGLITFALAAQALVTLLLVR